MSYLTVPTSHNRFAVKEETSPISPYYRDFDFGNLLSKWSNQEVLRSRESSPTRLDLRGENNPWNESVMQQMYDKNADTCYENSSSAILRDGSASNTDFKHFAKRKLIQSGGVGNWRQRNDDFTDVSSYSSIDSAVEMSHTSVAKNPMNYWTPTGARSSNSNSNSKKPKSTNLNPRSRHSEERTPASKVAQHLNPKQSSEKPFSTSRARITLSANAKTKTSKSVSPKRQETFNSEDDSSPEDEEVANDGKMRYIYKMTSVPLNSNPQELIRSMKSSHTSSNGRERTLEKTKADVKKMFAENTVLHNSQSGAINKAKQLENKTISQNTNVTPCNRNSNVGDRQPFTTKSPPKISIIGEASSNGKTSGGPYLTNGIQSVSLRKTGKSAVKYDAQGIISPPKLFGDESEKRAKLITQLLTVQEKTSFTNQKWFQIETLKLALENSAFYPDYYRDELEKHAADLCKNSP